MPSNQYFSYIRVSTAKQGQTGTSLTEQRAAIQRYAQRWQLTIVQEFEEKETAAKRGRPVFSQMLRGLEQGRARGVIIHKIDRSARNLKDWADLGELIDQGVEIHFANESLDLNSRGGRLSADIQAVVAADFIRNLREETRKGFYGRLRQGLYPCPAPVGYLDSGKGRVKEIDPVQAPLVRRTFEFYATGRWGINALVEKMYDLGLRNRRGNKVTRNGLSRLLNNPFYLGLIRLPSQGEMFAGQHQAIVSKAVFDKVQLILRGKTVERENRHDFIFRRRLTCSRCQNRLIGETQKGYIYYRCQQRGCPQKTVREEVIEVQFMEFLQTLCFNKEEERLFRRHIKQAYQNVESYRESNAQALNLELGRIRERLSKITDAYIDGMLEKAIYWEKKNSLLMEEQTTKEHLANLDAGEREALRRVEAFLELLKNAYLSYKLATKEEKRQLVKIITSNLLVKEKSLIIEPNYPFKVVSEREKSLNGSPSWCVPRTLLALLQELCVYFKENELEPESEEEREKKDYVPLDRLILIGAKKITGQTFDLPLTG
jgi:DNA invertase Pin-like site-specific DNA recombinase